MVQTLVFIRWTIQLQETSLHGTRKLHVATLNISYFRADLMVIPRDKQLP